MDVAEVDEFSRTESLTNMGLEKKMRAEVGNGGDDQIGQKFSRVVKFSLVTRHAPIAAGNEHAEKKGRV